jgi:hypothetical protein
MNEKTLLLKQQRKQLFNQLLTNLESTMLRGSLIERYKRCGRSNCKCAGTRGHGPKFYLSISMPGARPIMIYVPTNRKPEVEKALATYQEAKNIMERLVHVNKDLFIQEKKA